MDWDAEFCEFLMGQQSLKKIYAVHVDKDQSLLVSVVSISADQYHTGTANASIFPAYQSDCHSSSEHGSSKRDRTSIL